MTDLVEVTQADRDAVRAFHDEMGRRLLSDIARGTTLLDAKGEDSDPIYQAFARHRLGLPSPINPQSLNLVEKYDAE